jgi:hypothetical protein
VVSVTDPYGNILDVLVKLYKELVEVKCNALLALVLRGDELSASRYGHIIRIG